MTFYAPFIVVSSLCQQSIWPLPFTTKPFFLWNFQMSGAKCQPFIIFSVYTNGKKLFACKNAGQSSGKIQCIDGIRVISTIWVVYAHTYQGFFKKPLRETVTYDEVIVDHCYFQFEPSSKVSSIILPNKRLFFLSSASQYLASHYAAFALNRIVVDSFLVISALLVSYKMSKMLKK